ncbi:VOC family protein [Pontibacter sp. BAB1700]|uniref:VOC family protein n=1 Tax=Pontibacter sp. BAB1700 TaxID=1144253 RepID=UPI00026BCA1C|nr:VOC family protein [Pontibacter sp. BAB1700]EJF08626.1 hypothetical protein O71_19867 [Pontibacter sp. BAB1700]
MEQRITLITLGVRNLQRSKEFYQNVFGWQPLESSTESVIFFQLNGLQLACSHKSRWQMMLAWRLMARALKAFRWPTM